MAKKHGREPRRSELLPDPDDFYFDDFRAQHPADDLEQYFLARTQKEK